MLLKNLRVEGGFLGGLNLDFDSGLNVLIGARGVGKTAVIELIRFCLGAENLDPDLVKDSLDHATGVLEDGVAALEVQIDGELRTFTRAGTDKAPRINTDSILPLILSQREVETLARTQRGRLNLIDSFIHSPSAADKFIHAKIKALSAEIRDICGQIDDLEEQLRDKPALENLLVDQKKIQANLSNSSEVQNKQIAELDALQKELNRLTAIDQTLARAQDTVFRWINALPTHPETRVELEPWPGADDKLERIRYALLGDVKLIREMLSRAQGYVDELSLQRRQLQGEREKLEDGLRIIRQRLETDREGFGRVAREVSRLEESLSRMQSLSTLLATKKDSSIKAQSERLQMVQQLADGRERLFESRKVVCRALNRALQPRVKVDVYHSTETSAYELAIVGALRGSNLRYNEIAPALSKEVSPLELCEIVFERDAKRLSKILQISDDRAYRLVAALREGQLEEVLLAPLYDSVEFFLLDGSSYKNIDDLSIGQRCTVVLSIVFENANVVLVVDQPEDHLDNEFVAETLIRAISGRSEVVQTVVSTHNANIPVLGEASKVVHLDSNGKRGYIKCSGTLNSPGVVDAIVSVMEGGVDAFSRRAQFYGGET